MFHVLNEKFQCDFDGIEFSVVLSHCSGALAGCVFDCGGKTGTPRGKARGREEKVWSSAAALDIQCEPPASAVLGMIMNFC